MTDKPSKRGYSKAGTSEWYSAPKLEPTQTSTQDAKTKATIAGLLALGLLEPVKSACGCTPEQDCQATECINCRTLEERQKQLLHDATALPQTPPVDPILKNLLERVACSMEDNCVDEIELNRVEPVQMSSKKNVEYIAKIVERLPLDEFETKHTFCHACQQCRRVAEYSVNTDYAQQFCLCGEKIEPGASATAVHPLKTWALTATDEISTEIDSNGFSSAGEDK